jgi:hypothetical protein
MAVKAVAVGLLLGISALAVSRASGESVSLLSCALVKRVDSAYWYQEEMWSGADPREKRAPGSSKFLEADPGRARPSQPIAFLFSRLDEERVIVKQFYPDGTAGVELPAQVLNRSRDSVLVVWPLPMLAEVRFALINVEAKKAVISQMGTGNVALGIAAFLTECR